MAKVRAVILDVDGTVVDSNDAHAEAWVETLAEFGRGASYLETRRLIGMGGDKLLPELTGVEKDTEEGEQLTERREEIFKERYLGKLEPLPGARALVERLRAEGIEIVVATSAQRDTLVPMLEKAGVPELADSATSASDAEESKPAPDIVAAALEKTGEDAASVVMIGDTPYDVEAAERAGVRIIAVRSGGWDDHDLQGAIAVYDHLADLLERWDDSPLADAGGAE